MEVSILKNTGTNGMLPGPVVELHNAFVWDCESCGRENFVRAVTTKLDVQGLGSIGQWVTRPDTVRCTHCSATYWATDPMLSRIE